MLGIRARSVRVTVPVNWLSGPGVPVVEVYLEFLGGRCRPNTVRAAAYDLKVFFSVVAKRPYQIQPADVLAFVTAQRTGRGGGRAAAGGPGG